MKKENGGFSARIHPPVVDFYTTRQSTGYWKIGRMEDWEIGKQSSGFDLWPGFPAGR